MMPHHRLQRVQRLAYNWSKSVMMVFLLALPASTNYEMHDFAFGSGGVGQTDSTSYSLNAVTGETSAVGVKLNGTTYSLGPGLQFVRQAAVPPAPTLTNASSYYNKLLLQIATGGNPTDTTYAIAISPDSWVTTYYVQNDNTVGATLGSEDYQTYANWGGGSGEFIVGLSANTTYAVKVKAMQGKFTETEYSSEVTAATAQVSLTYDIDIAATDSESSPPYTIAFGNLSPGSVTTASNYIWLDLASNAESGAFVYVRGTNNGLLSANQSYTIPSVSADLAGQSEGYGIRVNTTAQTSGGPLTAVAPYVGAGDTVGSLTTTSQTIVNSGAAPIVGGRASILVKSKISALTPAASDYTDTILAVASATF